MKRATKKPAVLIFILLFLVVVGYVVHRTNKEPHMPPPLIYLIPEDYFGPVFVFFGQKDGVELQSDPLGQAVTVPENGVVKIKKDVRDVLGKSSESYRAAYMISLSESGKRKIFKIFVGTRRDEEGKFWEGFFDENSTLHKYSILPEHVGNFSYLPPELHSEPMIFNHDGCRHQGFTPYIDEVMTRKMTDQEAGTPACGKFLVMSPNEYLKMPDWMWRDVQRPYSSIQEFVDEANSRVIKKKEHYALSGKSSSW